MARQHRFHLLTPYALVALIFATALPLRAEEAPASSSAEKAEEASPPFARSWRHGKGRGQRPPLPPPSEEPDLNKLSPEERHRFEKNRERWEALAPEEKEALRKYHEERRARMQKSVDDAIAESGLKLTEEQRRDFGRRYIRERRKIEHELRREMNRKRKEQVSEMAQRLAAEFKDGEKAGE